ncbi:DUF7667 family protein [Paenibacillus sp. FSL L8-0708]
MLSGHDRLAELWTINLNRPLTDPEMEEMYICLKANSNYLWEVARLQQLNRLANQTSDLIWKEEIRVQMEELRTTGRVSKRH